MDWYQDVFNPVYYLLICAIIITVYDYKMGNGGMIGRITTILFSWAVAFLIYRSYFVFIYPSEQWIEDMFAVLGLSVAILITLVVWEVRNYGCVMPSAIASALAVTIPYVLISPYWNISGHVAYTTAPTVFIAGIDRRWIFLFIIPLLMVINRPYLGEHTIAESIAGFILGLIAIVGVFRVKSSK
jgi:membrane-associated phospholipid phosphatase